MILDSRNRPARHARARHQIRPRLDALEGRLLLNAGDLDTSFGNSGEVLTSFPATTKGNHATGGNPSDVKIQSDGKIIAAGGGVDSIALARYNTNGSLDSTFGSGGKVVTTYGPNRGGTVQGLAIQSDGKIIAVGWVANQAISGNSFAIERYNTNGTLDTSFGPSHNGLVTTIQGGDTAWGVVVQPDGKIVVAGMTSAVGSSTTSEALVRYNANGSLDTSFGQGGIVTMTIVPGGVKQGFDNVALETINVGGIPTTEIVASGPIPGQGSVLARFNLPDGSLDPSFGSGGIVVLRTVNPVIKVGAGQAIQPDGKIVKSGQVKNAQGVNDAAVARFNTDGSLDTTFGTNGLVDLGVPGLADRVVIQPDGKIIAGGYANTEVMLARLNSVDGSLDPTYGTNGIALKTLPGNPTAKGMALQPDGKIVTVGLAWGLPGSTDGYFAVDRFLGDPPPAAPRIAMASRSNPVTGSAPPLASPTILIPVAPVADAFDQALESLGAESARRRSRSLPGTS